VSLYATIADALLYFAQQVVASYERKLREKETEMADLRQQIKAMQDKIRKLDEVQASAAELLHRYNALVKQNADNKAALDELTAEFDKEIDETVAAMTENTEVEEPEEGEGDDPFTPSGNTPTGGSKSGAASTKKSSSKGKK
jgi:septal ring factor EnvC (AmiA/AmiB activator)